MQTPYAGSSLEELLADDLIQTMMDADKVSPALVRSLFHALARQGGNRTCGGIGHLHGADPQSRCHPAV